VHDDLPCMDNDDFRRGRPTLHRLQGEAGAVLAGDALLTGAFEILSLSALSNGAKVLATRELSRAAGGAGMVGGQTLDMDLKSETFDLARLTLNHNLKTGALFGASMTLGLIGARDPGMASESELIKARAWGVKLGLLFQVVDDILDANDANVAKGDEGPSFVKLLGVDKSRVLAEKLRGELATEAKALWSDGAASADSLVAFFVGRTV